jgi:hypothetical protein
MQGGASEWLYDPWQPGPGGGGGAPPGTPESQALPWDCVLGGASKR